MSLILVKLTKVYRQFNPGEVAGFDEETARFIVDHDMGVAQHHDAKTGKFTDAALPPKAAAETPKPAEPAPKGKKGAAAETPKPE